MDPAGPGFEDTHIDNKIESSDAQYVQCIHSDDYYGAETKYGCGHANFLMNGARNQPGCEGIMCEHGRAHEYFRESLSPKNEFWGLPCNEDDTVPYKNETIDIIGIHSKRINGTFCVPTNYESPYALAKDIVVERYWNPIEVPKKNG